MNSSLLLTANIFGTKHIVLLLVSIAAIIAISILLRNIKLKTWYRILLFVGIFSETLKLCTYIVINESVYGGYLPKSDLPFQLCSIQLIFIALLNFTKNEKLHKFLLSFMLPTCLIGGFAALALPTSSSLNNWVITSQYFIYHIMLVCFAIYLFHAKEIKWDIKDYVHCLIFLAFTALIAIYLNSMFYDVVEYTVIDGTKSVEFINRINFMYVVDPPASGLPILNKNHGWLVYIIHYAFIAVTAITLCYIKPIINTIKQKHATKKESK